MRAFLIAAVVLAVIAVGASFVLRGDARSTSSAYSTASVRLDPILIANSVGRMPPHVEH